MVTKLCSPPVQAWLEHIRPALSQPKWMEDSRHISVDIPLSKRELFALIVLAHLRNHQFGNNNWHVGYDEQEPEPNDGFVSDSTTTTVVEHKLVPQMVKQPALEAILSTYAKYAERGEAYGGNRVLIISVNKATQGMARISRLRDEIRDTCPFEQVLLIHYVGKGPESTRAIFHITEHYPNLNIAEVDLDLSTGAASVPHCAIAPV